MCYICDVMAVEEYDFCLFALFLLLLVPNFSDVLKYHVEEVIESTQRASELSFSFHNNPQIFANASVEE
mgnify:CR=1 FL=1